MDLLSLRMLFSQIPGQEQIKRHLVKTAQEGRIPHAQIFVGPEGSGTLAMAIAYAQFVMCANTGAENTGGAEACNTKMNNLAHPDLHFIFPTYTDKAKSKESSADFQKEWAAFVRKNPFGSFQDWFADLNSEGKNGAIRVADADLFAKALALKSYEGGYKVMIIAMADRMNVEVANKILKALEEPTPRTLIILTCEDIYDLLPTVRSRCQIVHFNKLAQSEIAEALHKNFNIERHQAKIIARRTDGNYAKALRMLEEDNAEIIFEKWFVELVRGAFKAKGNASAISDLIAWSEKVAKLPRNDQRKFLGFCAEMFRQAMLLNYQVPSLVYIEPAVDKFKLENFAPFVHGGNIREIYDEIDKAIFHVERNGSGKLIFVDLSIKLTRLIHKK